MTQDTIEDALTNPAIKTINLSGNVSLPGATAFTGEKVINAGGKTITIGGASTFAVNNGALGLHIGAGANVTIKNATILGTGFADNLIEVMGSGAKLTLENVTIQGSNQAAIYVGDSAADGSEKLTLKGNINFTNNAWGGVGVKNGATVDATAATFAYTPRTEDFIYTDAEVSEDTKSVIKSIIWDDSLNSTILVSDQLTKNFIYKVSNKKVKTAEDATGATKATQIIWSLQ